MSVRSADGLSHRGSPFPVPGRAACVVVRILQDSLIDEMMSKDWKTFPHYVMGKPAAWREGNMRLSREKSGLTRAYNLSNVIC